MPLGIRLSVVAFVLLVGVGSAMLFRKQLPDADVASRSTPDPLLLRKSPTEAPLRATVVRAAAQDHAGGSGAPREVSVVRNAPHRKVIPPPDLDTTFSTPLMPKRPRHDAAAPGFDQPERLPRTDAASDSSPPQRVRVVVDGDSLKSLAKRYLGSASRYMEIYEANLDVLSSPDLLPIGTKLKIPADTPPVTQPVGKPIIPSTSPPRMVPINR